MKKCPFKKIFIVEKYYTYGAGFPMANYTKEEFDECIGKECMAYKTTYDTNHIYSKPQEVSWCSLCRKDPN